WVYGSFGNWRWAVHRAAYRRNAGSSAQRRYCRSHFAASVFAIHWRSNMHCTVQYYHAEQADYQACRSRAWPSSLLQVYPHVCRQPRRNPPSQRAAVCQRRCDSVKRPGIQLCIYMLSCIRSSHNSAKSFCQTNS
ncbi:hypothetical protein FB639_006263, partial [Coemansia asiatica]